MKDESKERRIKSNCFVVLEFNHTPEEYDSLLKDIEFSYLAPNRIFIQEVEGDSFETIRHNIQSLIEDHDLQVADVEVVPVIEYF